MRAAARWVKRGLVDLYWMLIGPHIYMPTPPADPRSVLFVCKGNICRSPFAEQIASKLLEEMGGAGIRFASAGLYVSASLPSPERAIHVARRFGVNLENHRSQALSSELMESYDMIIAMEAWQYQELRSSFKQYKEKLFLLPLFDSSEVSKERGYAAFNIQDPYGGSPTAFEECFERIVTCLKRMFAMARPKQER